MLEKGGAKVLPVIPQLIIPIKSKCSFILVVRTNDQEFKFFVTHVI